MKKYILSILVVSAFVVYVFYQQLTGVNSTVVINTKEDKTTQKNTTTQSQTQTPVNIPVATVPKPVIVKGQYKDGQYTGASENAYYGYVQVQAIISGGKITDVKIIDKPSDRGTSIRINNQAMPILVSEAIKIQSANVNIVSGATDSSGAFRQSLGSALAQAKNS